ncbi:SDR family NAD(P)-dependent oxidoreductase [Arenivirga flava]|uniref:Oxidoreductase n=1 Tax=Arenivirga flava TaxID=1930060 RepID=A0AA37XA79_9MICO|nr:SDR family NAD(P)-dependent oxidoreductase [Arenivirga flava]GMA27553.1 oxidoreductase [Arenivirga flava]
MSDGGDLSGRRYVVTGGTAGLGLHATRLLLERGADVVLAARSPEKAQSVLAALRDRVPGARVEHQQLDLADLRSVGAAAERLASGPPVAGLLANAGVVGARTRRQTTDGFELQFGTNHLGHFALVAHLLPWFEAGSARIVHLGSISHRWFRLHLDDLQSERRYDGASAYARSKLAVMLFGFELELRLREAGSPASSIVAHPGFSWDELDADDPGWSRTFGRLARRAAATISQGKDAGAAPLVHALTAPDAGGGGYWGPRGWFQLKGAPTRTAAEPHARDRVAAAALWRASERATGLRIPT